MKLSDLREASEAKIYNAIRSACGQQLTESIAIRVSKATADGMLSKSELARVLQRIQRDRSIKNRSGYFVVCAKELFRQAGLPW